MAGIAFRSVEKRFGAVKAVDNVDFEIQDGHFVCLLGPSGCGKTTTLRMIAGLEQPTGGSIHIGDRDVTHLSPRDRDISMVFQDYALYPHMTLSENIAYPLKVRGARADERSARAHEAARHLQIDHLLDRLPGQISGGQQQRTSLARAVVHKPQVFLFDEPLSNLDAKLRLEARSFLKHLQKRLGVTSVYVTHDQAEAMALADQVVVMNKGCIEQMAPPLEVYHRPETIFVAGFVGSPPMNLIPVRIGLDGGSAAFLGARFRIDATPWRGRIAAAFQDGEEALLGIRPEHVGLADRDKADATGSVYAVEPLGAELLITASVGGTLVTLRLFGDAVSYDGDEVHLGFDRRRLHLFRKDGPRVELE